MCTHHTTPHLPTYGCMVLIETLTDQMYKRPQLQADHTHARQCTSFTGNAYIHTYVCQLVPAPNATPCMFYTGVVNSVWVTKVKGDESLLRRVVSHPHTYELSVLTNCDWCVHQLFKATRPCTYPWRLSTYVRSNLRTYSQHASPQRQGTNIQPLATVYRSGTPRLYHSEATT